MIDALTVLYLLGAIPALLPFLIKTVLLIAVSTLIGQMLQRKDGETPLDAKGLAITENPTDPNAPPPIPYGAPWWTLPLLMQYVSPAVLNSTAPSVGQRITRTFHAGAGPLDGSDLRLRAGGSEIFSVVNTDSPVWAQTLSPADPAVRIIWHFPRGDIIISSVTIYKDGTFYAAASEADGDFIPIGDYTTVTNKSSKPRSFTRSDDKTIPVGATRLGGWLHTNGVVSASSLTLTLHATSAGALGRSPPKSVTFGTDKTVKWLWAGSMTVPETAIHLGSTDDGSAYFWVDITFGPGTTSAHIEEWRFSYDVRPSIVLKYDTDTGRLRAVFPEAVAGGVAVTATYKTQAVSEDFSYLFRKGEKDQDPIAFDEDENSGGRNSYNVGTKLTLGANRDYSSNAEVDDIIIGLDSGPDGYFAFDDNRYKSIARWVVVQFKETSAADVLATKKHDPSTGWVELDEPRIGATPDNHQHYIFGNATGTVQWFRSIADCFQFTKTGRYDPSCRPYLKTAAYDVRVRALDAADTWNGTTDTTRFHSELYFASATELQRVGFVLPFHGDLTIQYGIDDLNATELIEASFKGRKVWSPDSAATYDSTLGYPTPGQWKWSRNPCECAVDHIVDKRFGAGRYYTWADVDLTSFILARDYCDAQIQFEDGVTEARAEVDVVLAEDGERRSLGERLADILGGSEVLAFWRGTWKFVIDQAADVVTDPVSGGDFTINEENELEQATLEVLGIEQIPTELSVRFRDREKDGAEDNEAVTLNDPQPTPRKVERVEFRGVQRRRQVRRVARILLQQKRLQTKRLGIVGTFGKGLRLLQLEPGDVVRYTSTRLGFTAKRFRVFETAWASAMKPALLLVEYDPAAYSLPWQGPNSAVTPGLRPPPPYGGGTTGTGSSTTSSGPPSGTTTTLAPLKVKQVRVTRGRGNSRRGDGIG